MILQKTSQIKKLALSKTARNVYWSFIGNGFYTFFSFVFFVLIAARALGPEDFGRFSAIFAFIILLSEFSDIGIGPSLSRFIPLLTKESKTKEIKSVTRAAFQFEIILASFLSIFVFVFAPFFSTQLFDNTDPFLIRLSSLGIIGVVLYVFVAFSLSARERFKEVAFLNIIISTTRVFIALVFVILRSFNLITALIALFLPTVITWAFSFKYLSGVYLSMNYEKEVLKKLLSFSKFLGVNKVFTALTSRLDVLMLIALAGAFESGIYSAAIRITQVYLIVSGSLMSVFAPRFSVHNTLESSWKFTKKVLLVAFALVFSVFIFFIISKPFILFVFGKEYEPSIPVFQALLIPMVFFILQLPFTGLIVYTLKKPQVFAFGAFVQLIFVFAGNLLFIPILGVFGPVVGLSLGYLGALLTLIAGTWYFGRRDVPA